MGNGQYDWMRQGSSTLESVIGLRLSAINVEVGLQHDIEFKWHIYKCKAIK